VCGDIHGSYSCVTKFLQDIHFDKSKDRFICAGDLVDRGPSNEACLDLLHQPWFFIAKGNHEQLMEDYFVGGYLGNWWGRNGGYWGEKYVKEDSPMGAFVRKSVKVINDLPYLITVEKKNGGVFHVMHAELPPFHKDPITDAVMADPLLFTDIATTPSNDGDMVTWGRHLWYSLYRQQLTDHIVKKFVKRAQLEKLGHYFNSKLSHIYSGHTIMKQPVRFKGQTNLDTCAYGSYVWHQHGTPQYPPEWCGLTVTEPATDKFWLVNDREFKEVQPVIIPGEIPPGPEDAPEDPISKIDPALLQALIV
jgi:Calcineurin-like phosphoesterase